MSYHSYHASLAISARDEPFSALIMAAMRKADPGNLMALRTGFPLIWDEFIERRDSPGGFLPDELEQQKQSEERRLEEKRNEGL